jgi:hypothetical protein
MLIQPMASGSTHHDQDPHFENHGRGPSHCPQCVWTKHPSTPQECPKGRPRYHSLLHASKGEMRPVEAWSRNSQCAFDSSDQKIAFFRTDPNRQKGSFILAWRQIYSATQGRSMKASKSRHVALRNLSKIGGRFRAEKECEHRSNPSHRTSPGCHRIRQASFKFRSQLF